MNHLFFPNRPKPVIGKAGINRVRQIIRYEKKQDKSTDAPNNNTILRNSMPTPWFYNKNVADKVWDGLEQTDKERQQLNNSQIKKEDENEESEKNPFFKIDKSTSKIRQLIDSFGVTDQEFLLNLMELLNDDGGGIDNLDQQSILFEAKLRLATMIDEHVGNSDAQSHMLDSLRVFFNDYQQGNQNAIENEMSNLNDFDTGVDSAQLAILINDACEKNEVCSEQASHIHKAIVDSFTRQMRDLKQEIDSRDKQIDNLQSQLDAHQKNRRNRRSEAAARKIKETNQVLAGAQRKICEQQTTINNLKSALSKNSIKIDANHLNEGQLSNSASSGNLYADRSINYSNENENENDSEFLSSDRELELMSKIHYLTEQVQSLKSEVSNGNKELKELKLSSIDLNNNYQALERAKKTADQTISGLTEKYEFMENMYKKKLAEANGDTRVGGNEKSENQIIADLKIEYEHKISSIKEQARQTQQQALDIAEKRHRMQMNDMLKSLENSDQSIALNEVMKNQESSINEVTERHKKQIIELKNMNNEKVRALTKQYEAKLMDAFKQNDSIRLSLKDDIAASLLKQKIELEANFQKKLNAVEADCDDQIEKMRKKLQTKIESVENLNRKLITERDALRDAIEDAQVIIDIPTAEDELFDENEEEEEEFEENQNNTHNNSTKNSSRIDDEMQLFDRNWAKQQVKKVKDEYIALMNQQRENIMSTKEWELAQIKKEMMKTFDEKMAERRMNLVSDLTDLRDSISNSSSNSEICEKIDNLITNLIKGIEKQNELTDDIINKEPTIPLSEANEKMDELNKRIVEVSSENEFLRNTLGKLSNDRSLKDTDGNDVVKVMRQAVAEETSKINDLLIENDNLRIDLEKAKSEINELKSHKDELFKQIEELKQSSGKAVQQQRTSSFNGSVSLPIKPSYTIENVSNDEIKIEKNKNKNKNKKIVCSKCGEKISLDPIILAVSTIESPIVECPFCHEAVQVIERVVESQFPKEEFSQQQLEQIGKMENEINIEVMNLIEMKKKMREGIDFSEHEQVITVNNKEENKTIKLTPNFDVTIFTLPPNPTAFSNKPSKDSSSSIPTARSFSPSSNRLFSQEQADKIKQMEGDIDKKINNLVDFKKKSTSTSNTNLNTFDDASSLSISKEIFFDSSEQTYEINREEKSFSNFTIFELNPFDTKKGRMILQSKSCDIYNEPFKRRVSFSSNLIKPPYQKVVMPNNIILQDHIYDTQLKITPALKSKFVNGYGGTSLDGSDNPFSRPYSELLKQNDGMNNRGQINKTDATDNNETVEANQATTAEKEQAQTKLAQSSVLALQKVQQMPQRPSLSVSRMPHINIFHAEQGGNAFARIQSQLMRSQQQQGQQQDQQIQQQNQPKQEEKKTFLTPEADIVSLQLSEAGYFSLRNSRPSSEYQQRTNSPSPRDSKQQKAAASNDISSEDLGEAFGEKLFVRQKPIGDPKAIEEFIEDLNGWRSQMTELKDQYKSMTNSYNEVSNMTHELVKRHNEIVKVLTKALDTAMSLAHGDAEHPEALIEKMQEQSAYLTTAIREKEILHSQSNEQLLIINERVQEVMQMHGETSEKEHEIGSLQKQLRRITEKEQQHLQQIHEFESLEKAAKENSEFQKNQINSIAEKLELECKKNFDLQKDCESLKVKVETLQTQLVIASKEPEIDMTSVEPFVIFSIDQTDKSARKIKGFGLQPKSSRNLSSTKLLPNKEATSTTTAADDESKEDEQNEVIHVSSFKKSDSKLHNSSGCFAVFQPEFTESSEAKMVYKASSGSINAENKEDNVEQTSVKPENPPENVQLPPLQSPKNPDKSDISISQPATIGGRIVESQKAQNLKKRLKQLESALVDKVNENVDVKEELHTTQQHLFKLTNMNAKIEREMKKAEVARDIAQKKLQSSMELIKTLSTENESLRALVEQYRQMARKFADDMKKASQFEESKNAALLNEMKTRSLLHDIQKMENSKYSLKSIADRQAIAIARWEGKRRFMQQKERQKIFSALQALNLVRDEKMNDELETIRSDSDGECDNKLVRKKSLAPGLKVAVYNIKKKSNLDSQIIDPNTVLEIDRPRSMPSYDEALKNANSHNQKVPKELKIGIIANPLKI